MRLSYSSVRDKVRQIIESSRFSSLKDAVRLHTFLRREAQPVQVACKYLKRKIWLRPATSDPEVFKEIFGDREYAEAIWDIKPKLIIDAGANIGLSSLYFAKRCAGALVVALEPEPSNVALLRRNTEGEKNITVKEGALWSTKTSLSLQDRSAEKWAFSVKEGRGDGSLIPAFTLPEILAETGFDEIDLLKLDIEGAERELFQDGWRDWLPKVKRIVIELHDRLVPGCSMAFYSAIVSRNFRQRTDGQGIVIDFEVPHPSP